jgi:hypothetical protein
VHPGSSVLADKGHTGRWARWCKRLLSASDNTTAKLYACKSLARLRASSFDPPTSGNVLCRANRFHLSSHLLAAVGCEAGTSPAERRIHDH